jgi:hypothetical protein
MNTSVYICSIPIHHVIFRFVQYLYLHCFSDSKFNGNLIQMTRQVLATYRELISLIRRLPKEQQKSALEDARSKMRQHGNETDPALQLELFERLTAKLSFLRMITPRKPGETSMRGTGKFVLRNGELVEGEGRSAGTRWVGFLFPNLRYHSAIQAI